MPLLPFAFCLLPFAFCLLPFAFPSNKIWYFNKYPLIFGALFGSYHNRSILRIVRVLIYKEAARDQAQ
jgi:hypothetical protein